MTTQIDPAEAGGGVLGAEEVTSGETAATQLDQDDIQGNILRGYHVQFGRHFLLTSTEPAATRTFLAALVNGGTQGLRISRASDDPRAHTHHLNLGLTWEGLNAIGVPPGVLDRFPVAFKEGAAARADQLGDTGESAPANWHFGGPANPPVHLVVSLYTRDAEELLLRSAQLEHLSAGHSLIPAPSWFESNTMGDGQLQFEVHFGYRDGISQPQIEGVEYPKRKRAASVPMSKPGDFLLGKGYANVFRGNYLYGIPAALGDNATYGVFRKAEQDVFGFEKFLIATAKSLGIDRELLAAKLMGRWRNGSPLSLTPDTPQPAIPILEEDLNNFDYVPTPANPAVFDDSDGLRCPIGSHARRMYPRSQTVVGKSHSRRLIRRSMPYGPRVDPSTVELETPDDGIERGLIGFFICGDIANQFEFIIKAWANHDLATTGILGTLDPVIGAHPDDGGRFLLPGPNGTVVLTGLRRHVHTRGSIYCLIPGIGGLQWLADQ